ncbi:unnamed protein product [Caenorhabditis auriculariae]|uniref:Uncharacterized protein n=1 Tax=Caenorhabditis auriculariae TaxID=2777116 RepID=A0A8S1H030_9PELO|nr:unnamed protein product [Caenorhabditis auriculariae]
MCRQPEPPNFGPTTKKGWIPAQNQRVVAFNEHPQQIIIPVFPRNDQPAQRQPLNMFEAANIPAEILRPQNQNQNRNQNQNQNQIPNPNQNHNQNQT